MDSKRFVFLLTYLFLASLSFAQEPFEWNQDTPIKRPGDNDNGKLVLFDVSHGGTQGNADWVIDGGFSDFADALVAEGFTVQEYRGVDLNGDGRIAFTDDRRVGNLDTNEAVITFDAIQHADVFVLAETNRPFRVDEYAALKQFVDAGKGIYFISDHYNADRNRNTWDSTEVFNGYNRSRLNRYAMEPHYGDLRNPQSANAGWLVENFGLRFRFNAVDWKPGASSIMDPNLVEGLTDGAGPVLIAAGGTLAIVDPTKAKGLVYFSDADDVKSWRHAVEGPTGGMYFDNGLDEGPVVAISKPSAGKAAFIGDSSPIEDITPKYLKEDSGQRKSLHPGWTDGGNAAQLSLNIVKWLATPEDYVGFNSPEHPPGFATPEPMAAVESTDPDNGQPWANPRNGHDPWDPDTFANGAYGARFPATSSSGGGFIPAGEPIDVSVALMLPNNQMVKVMGRVTDELNTVFGLELTDKNDSTKKLAVQLPARFRSEFNPRRNPSILNQDIVLVGRRNRYMGLAGIKDLISITQSTGAESIRAIEDTSTLGMREIAVPQTIEAMKDGRSVGRTRHRSGMERRENTSDVTIEMRTRLEELRSEIRAIEEHLDTMESNRASVLAPRRMDRSEAMPGAESDAENLAQTTANTIQIGTYNLELLGKSRRPFNGQERPFRTWNHLREIANRITQQLDLEFVILQEINTDSRNWGILKGLLSEEGYRFFEGTTSSRDQFVVLAWDADEVDLFDGSAQELDVRTTIQLPGRCESEGLRKPVAGRFQAGEFDFWVVGVHLKSRVGSGSCPSQVRREQSKELVSAVDDLIDASGERDVIIAGDLNERIGHRSLEPLVDSEFIFQTRFLTDNSGSGSYIKTWNPHQSDDLIDHVLLRYSDTREVVRNSTTVFPVESQSEGIRYVRQQSDHVPVWTSFYIDQDLDDND